MYKREDIVYIMSMRDSIRNLREFTLGVDLGTFLSSKEKIRAVERELELLGQAAKDLGIEKLEKEFPDFLWSRFKRLRDVLAHEYIDINAPTIFSFVQTHLSELESIIEKYFSKI